ncbi:MAG: hypothetical protein EA353_05305 [Puniceicoccaceae bacterium]|nr:MAG: hypothetical protein EA353_05305 [Puniceicoccaceae bacterium]
MFNQSSQNQKVWIWRSLLVCLALFLFAIRLTGPTDMEGYAQHRNIGYVMDTVWEGNWLAHQDIQNRVMSKPPVHTWLAGLFSLVFGVDYFAMALPSFLALLALALLVFEIGRRRLDTMAAGFAGLAFLLAPLTAKHIALIRTDALFTLTIALVAWAALRKWERGSTWTLFWAFAAIATMVKGPVGLILGAAGLLAYFWERRTDPNTPRLTGGGHLKGLALFFGIAGGWFIAAWLAWGPDLLDKMLFDELFGQATGARKDSFPGENLPKPTLYFLGRFLPFSLFTFYGLWRVCRRPESDPAKRRFERFLFCWIGGGLLMFSLAAHHRPDLLLPLWTAGALLAGREMARLAKRIGPQRMTIGTAVIASILVATTFWNYHQLTPKRAEIAQFGIEARQAAEAFATTGLNPHTLYHLDTPVTFQLYLKTFRTWSSPGEISQLIESGEPLLVAVTEASNYSELFEAEMPEEVFRWPPAGEPKREPTIRVMKFNP